jgi:hypothetical protein
MVRSPASHCVKMSRSEACKCYSLERFVDLKHQVRQEAVLETKYALSDRRARRAVNLVYTPFS